LKQFLVDVMKISERTIDALIDVILGVTGNSPFRKSRDLVEYCEKFGVHVDFDEDDDYLTKRAFVAEILTKINGTTLMPEAILASIDPVEYANPKYDLLWCVEEINHGLQFDGFEIVMSEDDVYEIQETGEPDWESGDKKSLFREFKFRSEQKEMHLPRHFIQELADDLEDAHTVEQGMAQQFNDLAAQQWLVDFVLIALKKYKAEIHTVSQSEPSNIPFQSRKHIIVQTKMLISALEENLDVTRSKRNESPSLDLALHETPEFVDEVQRLTDVLKQIEAGLSSDQKQTVKNSLAKEALREFVLKLSGSAGTSIGKSVGVATQVALAELVPI